MKKDNIERKYRNEKTRRNMQITKYRDKYKKLDIENFNTEHRSVQETQKKLNKK